ncbi:unnamed protein product [Clonostachys rosea]|uniref:Glutamate-1-semialdehyde 2,1-aminomutase n=1 Tax=Bionectria ochroleuca TaxID=29856 RepID=A0ABY6UI80_BIOOC|nr:unnamed protein product [Clonostachys rosea]
MSSALDAATTRFVANHPKSAELHQGALASLPGGNTRTALWTAPFPISIARGEGYKVWDEDGNEYNDFVSDLTAGLYGHSHPVLQQALVQAIYTIGTNLGGTTKYEQRYASLLCERFGLDLLRFSNSGTEANIHALAAARRFTGRRKVIAFRGAYHGSVLAFANGVAANNVDPEDWIVCQYNDVVGLEEAFQANKEVAAVILEAAQGSGGSIPANPEFLDAVRSLSQEAGALFILDEVMTSRLGPGGLKGVLQLKPDLVTLGKYLGGGMPFGAFGGRADILSVYDPRSSSSLAHSGTFQNNALMLNAGFIGASQVYTADVAEALNRRGDELRAALNKAFEGTIFCVTGRGSLMCVHAPKNGLRPQDIACKDDVAPFEDLDLKKLFWLEMLEAGFWLQLRGSIALNIQLPDEVLSAFVDAVRGFCKKNIGIIALPSSLT